MKLKKSIHLLVALTLQFTITIHANAGGNSTGPVISVYPIVSGQVFVATASAASQPACAVYGWAIDLNGSAAIGGKTILATIMWALAVGKPIVIVGKGICDVWGDRETIYGVIVN